MKSRLALVGAVASGVVVGVLARSLPITIALAVSSRGGASERCSTGPLECALSDLPGAFGAVLLLVLLVVGIALVLTALGTTVAAFGALRLRRRARTDPTKRDRADGHFDLLGLGLVGGGISLLVPGLWLVASLLVSIVI